MRKADQRECRTSVMHVRCSVDNRVTCLATVERKSDGRDDDGLSTLLVFGKRRRGYTQIRRIPSLFLFPLCGVC